MAKNFFVTGTDTDAGKTLVSEALLIKAGKQGLQTLGLKPIAAGSEPSAQPGEGLVNHDAVCLQRSSTVKLPYQQVNPILFDPPIAPHIAAAQIGKRVSADQVAGYLRGSLMQPADLRLIEGAGGWLVPLNEREPFSQIPKTLNLDVILVVGMKLGCLNHALLTARAIHQDGLKLAGWVATQIDPDMLNVEENLASLKAMLPAKCLGFVPWQPDITAELAAEALELPELG